MRLRMFAIAAGFEDADDCDALRHDPVFKMVVGHAPESGAPAVLAADHVAVGERACRKIELAECMGALVDQCCDGYRRAPEQIILDIDDTLDRGARAGSNCRCLNAHYDERCFLPIHIYGGLSGKPVAMILRAGMTPGGVEVRTILKHLVKRIRGHWPRVRILVRGDSHYGRHEAMEWCENNGVDYIFGLAGNKVLAALVRAAADNLCVRRAISGKEKLRRCLALGYGAESWKRERAVVARLEATTLGLDIRYVVTSREPLTISMKPSIVRAAKPRTSSSCTRPSSLPIGPPAEIRAPIRCASSCTPPPIGSITASGPRRPRARPWCWPSSAPCACA